MVGNKLNKLKKEINKYIGIPYWINKIVNKKIVVEGAFGGKGNIYQISDATQKAAEQEALSLSKLSTQDKYKLQKRNNIGIDCSGLTYHLLDFWYKVNTGLSIQPLIMGTDNKIGPRRVNVKMLTDPQNSTQIKNLSNIKTGDIIVIDNKKHILFIIEINKNTITYVHSSQKTKQRGVHFGTITITDPTKNLTHQIFSDQTRDNKKYSQIIYPKYGDGIYRLNIFKN